MRKSLVFLLALSLPALAQPVSRHYDRLWVQTSADYRAHCYQTYGWASRTLRERAELTPGRDAEGRVVERLLVGVGAQPGWVERPLAVVMDLDETVLDMSAYRVFLTRTGQDYTPESWNAFLTYQAEHPHASRAVPGALDFIREAQQLGFTVIFISNRTEDFRDATLRTLQHLGIQPGPRLYGPLLDEGKETDHRAARELLRKLGLSESSPTGLALLQGEGRKERRRLEASLRFHPIMFIGDDLGDFFAFLRPADEKPESRIAARYRAIDQHRQRWGREFFYIPNPMYGNWSPGATLPSEQPEALLRDDGFTDHYLRSGR